MRKPEKTHRYIEAGKSPEEPEPGYATLERLEHLAAGNPARPLSKVRGAQDPGKSRDRMRRGLICSGAA